MTIKLGRYSGNIVPSPAGIGATDSSERSPTRPIFPSTVVIEHTKCNQGGTLSSPEDTGPTCIEISPLSTEDSPVDAANHCEKREYGNLHSASQNSPYQMTSKHEHTKSGRRKREVLTWRMDPSISLSDFTLTFIGVEDNIAVTNYLSDRKKKKQQKKQSKMEGLYLEMSQSQDDSNGGYRNAGDTRDYPSRQDHVGREKPTHIETYHLHRVNLAVGPKSCDYFVGLFCRPNSNHSHTVEIPLSCLPAIPVMLDFIYCHDTTIPLAVTTATAISLRYLGTLLGSRQLFNSATQFLRMDLCADTAIDYLQQAELYRQTKVASVCIRICAECFDQLTITRLALLAPHLMEMILYSKHFTRSLDNLAVCRRIGSYCRCQLHKLDRTSFGKLTSEKVMPVVCPQEALFFIQMMIRFGMDSPKEELLYGRCVDAAPTIVQGVIDFLCQDTAADVRKASRRDKNSCGDYSRLPSRVKVDLLEYTLASSRAEIQDLRKTVVNHIPH